jgi:hypothetical protein
LLQLREEEAEYLHQQIMTNVPGTLIAFLVDQGEWWDVVSFPWHHPQVGECASHVKAQLHHAELFSLIGRLCEPVDRAALSANVGLFGPMTAEKAGMGRKQNRKCEYW